MYSLDSVPSFDTHPSWFKEHLIRKSLEMAGKTETSGPSEVGGGDWVTALNNMKSNVVTEINTQVVYKCSLKLVGFFGFFRLLLGIGKRISKVNERRGHL